MIADLDSFNQGLGILRTSKTFLMSSVYVYRGIGIN